MLKIFVASFNRASDGAISKLVQKMKEEGFYTDNYNDADYILACADRKETFDFILERFRENKKIIHLWAGEISQGTHDEVYRHSITLMSDIQLCTNDTAKERVKELCKSVNKKYIVFTVGNIMLDNLEIKEPKYDAEYNLILYNPTTLYDETTVEQDIDQIKKFLIDSNITKHFWIEPNGDRYSELITYDTPSLPREEFLGLLKNCKYFITNSSCQFYEAPFLIKPEQIIPIGKRNENRESKYGDMTIKNASDRIINIFKWLDGQCIS